MILQYYFYCLACIGVFIGENFYTFFNKLLLKFQNLNWALWIIGENSRVKSLKLTVHYHQNDLAQ